MDGLEEKLLVWSALLDETLALSQVPLRRLAKKTAELSDILVGKKRLTRYFEEEEFIKAYAAFFFPQTFARTFFVIGELFGLTDLKAQAGELKVLDVGSGIGASLFAACEILKHESIPFRADAVEIVKPAAEVLETLAVKSDLSGNVKIRLGDFNKWKGKNYNLIVASTALSESPDTLIPMARRLSSILASPGCLVVIEPSWKKGFDLVREAARAIKKHPLLPCLEAETCSAEKKGDWCHASFDLRFPDLTYRVNQLLGHNLGYVKFAYSVFSNDVELLKKGIRVISPLKSTRGKCLIRVCNAGEAFWLERLNKEASQANSDFDACMCGDIVEFDSRELKGGGRRLDKSHKFNRL